MTLLDDLPRMLHLYEGGVITAEEFANKLTQCLAYDEAADPKQAADVAALIPSPLRAPLRKQIDAALEPEYIRHYICSGTWPEDKQRAADLRVTDRERAWAAALKPFF